MDSLDSGDVKRKGKEKLDQDHEREEERPRCDSLQQSNKYNLGRPFLMPLLPAPKLEDLETSIVLTGTACGGVIGPSIGAVDIGVSKFAYYFCIVVPGVKKDTGEFSCEIHRDGKVCVEGETSTGGNTVSKYSRVFIMKLQQRCPPGPFKLFFTLPGPVDPRLFSGSFRPDGIFEGVVAKHEQ